MDSGNSPSVITTSASSVAMFLFKISFFLLAQLSIILISVYQITPYEEVFVRHPNFSLKVFFEKFLTVFVASVPVMVALLFIRDNYKKILVLFLLGSIFFLIITGVILQGEGGLEALSFAVIIPGVIIVNALLLPLLNFFFTILQRIKRVFVTVLIIVNFVLIGIVSILLYFSYVKFETYHQEVLNTREKNKTFYSKGTCENIIELLGYENGKLTHTKEGCYYENAISKVDPTFCEKIMSKTVQQKCYLAVRGIILESDPNSQYKDYKYKMIPALDDTSQCDEETAINIIKSREVNHFYSTDNCYHGEAMVTKNSAYCQKIVDDGIRKDCKDFFVNYVNGF